MAWRGVMRGVTWDSLGELVISALVRKAARTGPAHVHSPAGSCWRERGRPPEPPAPARPALFARRPVATKSSGFFAAVPGVAGGSVEVLSTVPDKAAPRPHGRPVGVETPRHLEARQMHLPRGGTWLGL